MSDGNSTVTYKDIPGFPGYRVGDDGSVWSCWRRKGCGTGRGTRAVMSHMHWHRLSTPRPCRSGHLRVNIKGEVYFVHRLILLAFVGECPADHECCHNDGNPTNNTLTNLRWDTRKANMVDQMNHGDTTRGERQWTAKATAAIVRAIRAEHAARGTSSSALAKKHNLSRQAVRDIIVRRTWNHIE